MKTPIELMSVFEKNFKQGMINKDFNAFKKSHPTLLKVIQATLIEIEKSKNNLLWKTMK